jgi:hypothetical protein
MKYTVGDLLVIENLDHNCVDNNGKKIKEKNYLIIKIHVETNEQRITMKDYRTDKVLSQPAYWLKQDIEEGRVKHYPVK